MRPRTALLAVVAAALVVPTPAMAKAKPKPKPKPLPKACLLMEDAKDDGDWNTASVVKSPALDIQSADVATGPTEFVAVLRLGSTNFSSDQFAVLGYSWRLGASAGGARYEFGLRRGGTGSYNLEGSIGGQAIPNLKYEIGNNQIVWRFPRKGIAALTRPNLVFTSFGANSNVLSSTADDAQSNKQYKDRQPSCVLAK